MPLPETRQARQARHASGADGEQPADVLESVLTIMRMARALERVDAGLSPQQYRILKLAGAGGERSARLAERLAVAKPTLTAIADGLVAAGLARRVAEPGDRRVVRLQLTEAGSAAVERADSIYAQWLAGLLEESGRAGQIHEDLRLLDAAMDERLRAGIPLAGTTPALAGSSAEGTGRRGQTA